MFQLSLSIGVRTGGRPHPKQDSDPDTIAGERLQKERPHPNRSGCCDGCVGLAWERLPNQRPLGKDHPEHIPEEQLVAQVPYQGEEAGSVVLHSSSNVREFVSDNKEARVTTSAAAKESEEFLYKDAEILRDSSRKGEAHPRKRNKELKI